jgi:hypothetical protein
MSTEMKCYETYHKRLSITENCAWEKRFMPTTSKAFLKHETSVSGVGLGRLDIGMAGSNPAQGMVVCPRLSVL